MKKKRVELSLLPFSKLEGLEERIADAVALFGAFWSLPVASSELDGKKPDES